MAGSMPEFLVISDRYQARHSIEKIADWSFAAGLRTFMLRDKDLPRAERQALAQRLSDIARRQSARLIINGDWTMAAQVGAAGVHLQQPRDIPTAREILGEEAMIGLSAHSRDDLVAAADKGANYATLSPVFLTQSKPGYGPALGIEGFRALVSETSLPVLALGGITTLNARQCLQAGAAGLSVMGAVMRAEKPGEVVRQLLQELR